MNTDLKPLFISYCKEQKDYHSTLNIIASMRATTKVDIEDIKIEFISSGRSETSYEIFDANNMSLGDRSFSCTFGPVSGIILKKLVDDLNVLFELYGYHMSYTQFEEISKLAVSKCESRYGYSIEGGDCIINLTK